MVSSENLTSVRPGRGPVAVESPGSSADIVQRNAAPVATAKIENHDHGERSDARLAIILASGALFGLVVSLVALSMLYTEYRLADVHLRDMKAAMLAHGINPNPHMPGESP